MKQKSNLAFAFSGNDPRNQNVNSLLFSQCHQNRRLWQPSTESLSVRRDVGPFLAWRPPTMMAEHWENMMQTPKHEGNGSLETSEHVQAPETEGVAPPAEDRGDMVATVATVAVVGIAAAAFEAALLPGIVLGVAAVAVPRFLPKAGAALNPLFRSSVRGVYKMGQKTKEMLAEAHEQVNDIVAEVHAEGDVAQPAPRTAASVASAN
jgi:hypothetical protein